MNYKLSHKYLTRTRQLARLGSGNVSPNPMVGALLVHNGRIIGEGWHREYGQAHAEVNAIASVSPEDKYLISESTIYCSLEPCCIHRNTPACTDLIIKNKIKNVVIGGIDLTAEVSGQGVKMLRRANIDVTVVEDSNHTAQPHLHRNIFASKKRPYVILKWAQSANGYIGSANKQIWFSNAYTKRLVHKWRSEVSAIMIGTNTAVIDNPKLTTRLYHGSQPTRIVPDIKAVIPITNHLFDNTADTWVLGRKREDKWLKNVVAWPSVYGLSDLVDLLYSHGKNSLLVEGGAALINSFIKAGLWDEARIISTNKFITKGVKAPIVNAKKVTEYNLVNDQINVYRNA